MSVHLVMLNLFMLHMMLLLLLLLLMLLMVLLLMLELHMATSVFGADGFVLCSFQSGSECPAVTDLTDPPLMLPLSAGSTCSIG